MKFLYFFKICIWLEKDKNFFDLYFAKFFGYLKILDFRTLILCVGLNLLIHAYGPEKKVLIMPINKTINKIEKTANLKVKKIVKLNL